MARAESDCQGSNEPVSNSLTLRFSCQCAVFSRFPEVDSPINFTAYRAMGLQIIA